MLDFYPDVLLERKLFFIKKELLYIDNLNNLNYS